jgi:hypothetical protein
VVAIDGKTLRRTFDRGRGLAALHPVSAWASSNDVTLRQLAVDAKSNEITAIPQLLDIQVRSPCLLAAHSAAGDPTGRLPPACPSRAAGKAVSVPLVRRRSTARTPVGRTVMQPC